MGSKHHATPIRAGAIAGRSDSEKGDRIAAAALFLRRGGHGNKSHDVGQDRLRDLPAGLAGSAIQQR